MAWSPTGRELAYVVDTSSRVVYHRADLRVATTGGAVRTAVPAAGFLRRLDLLRGVDAAAARHVVPGAGAAVGRRSLGR